jgi:hypothetical protein
VTVRIVFVYRKGSAILLRRMNHGVHGVFSRE